MKNIRLFNIISFLKGLYFYIPIFTFFLLSKDISLSAVIISQTFYSLFTFLGEVPTGIFADRFGQKTSIVIGYILEAFGIVFILFYPTTLGLYIAFSIRGFADSFLSGSKEALLFETVKSLKTNDYQKRYGRIISNEQIGFVLATALCGLAYQQFGQSSFVPLIILTGVCLFGAGILSIFLTNYKTDILDESEGSGMFSVLKQSFGLIRKNSTIFTLTIVGVLTITGEYFVQGVYQPYFQTNGVPPFWIGASLSVGIILNIIATRYVYLLERYFTLEKILLYLNGLLGLAYILMAVFLHPIFLIGLYVLMNGIFGLQTPIVSDYINTRTKSSIRATVLSGISFIRRFFQLFLTWGIGICVGVFGVQMSLLFWGLYLLIGIGISYYLLVRCGCTHKIVNTGDDDFEFKS
jgi:MFS family permease